MGYSGSERTALCALLDEVGPDAPTLCAGWTTYDLVAHLVARERRPDSGPGLLLSMLRPYTERIRGELIRRHPYPDLVDAIRNGPPRWSPYGVGLVNELVNTVEFYIHHEDVRRAAEEWQPRALDTGMEALLWRRLRGSARLLLRRSPVGVVLRLPNGATVVGRSRDPWVTLIAPASELILFVFGRQRAARVEADGDDAAVEALRNARLNI